MMVVVIAGPTGVGKTALSIEVAKHYDTEIISGDSMQVYKTLDIGTAKVTAEEADGIPHHMIDILSPEEPFSVAMYQREVRALIKRFEDKGKLPLIVGGTGFYIKSVLHDFDFDGSVRDEDYDRRYRDLDNKTLHERLKAKDPKSADTIHQNNRKRVLQALIRAEEGTPKSARTEGETPLYDYCLIVLRMERTTLYERINQRVDAMIQAGLLKEARALYEKGPSSTAAQAIGYKELFEYFEGHVTLETAIETIKRNTRRYAKRQYTYFFNQFDPHVIDVDGKDIKTISSEAISIIDRALKQA